MRYPTLGDYQELKDRIEFSILDVKDGDKEFRWAIHELIEKYLNTKRGISDKTVDKWDFAHLDSEDPGTLDGCPYKRNHDFATLIEYLIEHETGD